MESPTGMRAIVRMVEAGSFTRASELLKIPKSTQTKALLRTSLQSRLGLAGSLDHAAIVACRHCLPPWR
jgi:hypothetical protein